MTMAGTHFRQQVLQQCDALDVEVVGRLVEQQQVGFQRQRQCQRGALALAARDPRRIGIAALLVIVQVVEVAAQHQALAQARCLGQLRFLLDQHHARAARQSHLAVVEHAHAGDHAQQR
jgi:hypothetical protein